MFTCAEVAQHYRRAAAALESDLSDVVVNVIERSVVRAKGYIGHPQDGWAPLSEATIEGFRHERGFWITGKRELGFSPPDYEPLLRTSQMRGSIAGAVEGLRGIVGSPDKVAVYQEMGTPGARYPIPPRPFLARALQEAVPLAEAELLEVAERIMMPVR